MLKKKTGGGIVISKSMGLTLTKIDEKMIRTILQGYKMHVSFLHACSSSCPLTLPPSQNCDVLLREDITVDQFIDVVLGTRKYMPCLYVYNKIDSISLEEMDKLARRPHSIVVSCELNLNLDRLLDRIWVSRVCAQKEKRAELMLVGARRLR